MIQERTKDIARSAPAALFLLGVALLLTWPTAWELGVMIPGHPMSDAAEHLQGSWWFSRELAAGRLPLETRLTHWPPGGALWYVDPLGALLAWPLQGFGPLAAFSLAVIVQVWAGLLAAYILARFEGADRHGAVAGALVYGASGYVMSLLYIGTTEYLNLAALPLYWIALRLALRHGGKWIVAAGVLGAWATLGAAYYGAFAALLTGIALVVEPGGEWRRRLARAWGVGLVLVGLAGPGLALAWSTLHADDAVIQAATAPGWTPGSLPAIDLRTFFWPGGYYFPDNRAVGNAGIIHVNYLGWAAILAAAWRLRHMGEGRRAALLGLLLAMVLAAGPTLCVSGHLPRLGGATIPLPAAILYYLPLFSMIHHPYRLVVLPLVLLVPLVARAVTGWRAWLLGALVLAETLWLSPAVFPIPTLKVEVPASVLALPEGGIWELPPEFHTANRAYTAAQVLHGRVIPYGVNQFLPPAWRANHWVRSVLKCLKLEKRSIGRDGGPPAPSFGPADPLEVGAGLVAWKDAGYRHVVLHLDAVNPAERHCLELRLGAGRLVDRVELFSP